MKRFQHRVRVLFHLDGCTQVALESAGGHWGPDGGPWRRIPTDLIPPHLRQIGARFLVDGESPDPAGNVESIRETVSALTIREFPLDWLPMSPETMTGTLAVAAAIDVAGRGAVILGDQLGGTLQVGMRSEGVQLPGGAQTLTIRSVEFADDVRAGTFRTGIFTSERLPAAMLSAALVGRDMVFRSPVSRQS